MMNTNTFDLFSGDDLKHSGMNLAVNHANKIHPEWSDEAYSLLMQFVATASDCFMCEDIRAYADEKGLPEAPNNRAWGAIIQRAARKEQIIKHVGYAQVTNPRAHKATASLWMAA